MAVTGVTEIWNGRTATHDIGNVREYKRTFLIQTNNALDGPFQVGNNFITGLPGLFTPYVDAYGIIDFGSIVQRYTPRQTDDPFYWEVDVEYSSSLTAFESPRDRAASGRTGKAEQAGKGSEDQNPLNRPPVIRISGSRYQQEIYWTTDDPRIAIVNSAGDPFDPPVMVDATRLTITYDRNERSLDFNKVATYQDVINNDPFWGQPPRTFKLNMNAGTAYENGLFYWQVTYLLEFRFGFIDSTQAFRGGWPVNVVDKGLRYLDKNKVPQNINDSNGLKISVPVPLDGQGHQLVQINPNTGKLNPLVYLPLPSGGGVFNVYQLVPFGPLSLSPPS